MSETIATPAVIDSTLTLDTAARDRATDRLIRDYSAADAHADTATMMRGRAVVTALSSGLTIDDVASALTNHYGAKVSKPTLSNAGRAYRVVRDTDGVSASGKPGAINVGAVAAAINRGAVRTLNDWEAEHKGETFTDDTFVAAMRSLTKPDGNKAGERKPSKPTTPAEVTPANAVNPTGDDDSPTADAVAAGEMIVGLGSRRWSESERATLRAAIDALHDALDSQDLAALSETVAA